MATTDARWNGAGVEIPPDLAGLDAELYKEDFSTLGQEIEEMLREYVVIGRDQSFVLARHVIHTWTYLEGSSYVTPYLYLHGQMQAGKTRTLEWLKCMVRNGESATEASLPAMWLLIETGPVTLLFDEADTIWRGTGDNEWKKRTINMGYKEGEDVKRKEQGELRRYKVYCPKIIAGINNGQLPETIRDRSIPIELQRKRPEDRVARWRPRQFAGSAQVDELLGRIARYRERFAAELAAAEMDPIQGLSDRQNEICEPLVAIAATLGEEDEMRTALSRLYASQGQKPSHEQVTMARIRVAFDKHGGRRIFTDELCEELDGLWRNGKQLSRYLAQFGVRPSQVRRGARERRGYKREDFQELFEQHLGEEHKEA